MRQLSLPMTARPPAPPSTTTNAAKFETTNPVVQRMIGRFFAVLREVVEPLEPTAVLDAGCGEGETLVRLGDVLGDRIAAIDIERSCVERVRQRLPSTAVRHGDVTALPYADDEFDLLLCLEVIEHVPEPARAVAELARVSRRDVVVSVPFEPWFRIGSLLRGNYLRTLGNHPEHVNHFSRRSLTDLLEPALEVREVRVAFPWLIAACRAER